jgi:FkbM family methyltransferase
MNYSQNNEQQVILDYFGSQYTGSFLDLGANDGQTLSNTRALALNGWGGVLVEASPKAAAKAKELYVDNPNVIVRQVAVANHIGRIKFYESGEHLGKGDISLVSTVVQSERDRWKTETFTETIVDCDTVANIIGGRVFDFISIDIEGMDYEVLTQIHLTGVKMVCVEYNGIEPKKYIDYCAKFGLAEVHRNGENLIFAAVLKT